MMLILEDYKTFTVIYLHTILVYFVDTCTSNCSNISSARFQSDMLSSDLDTIFLLAECGFTRINVI